MGQWRVREYITSDIVPITWVVADGVDGQHTSTYLTPGGVLISIFNGGDIRFYSQEAAEAALAAAKIRGDVL